MARIGNEAKLILKLAKERMASLRDSQALEPDTDYYSGYNHCFSDFEMIINSVVQEVEQK